MYTRRPESVSTRTRGRETQGTPRERTVRTAWGCAWRARARVCGLWIRRTGCHHFFGRFVVPLQRSAPRGWSGCGKERRRGCTGELLGEWERRARGGRTCDASAEGVLNRPCEPSPAHRPDRSDATAARNMAIPCIFEICFVRVQVLHVLLN